MTKKSFGFTLIEILIALFIFSIIAMIMTAALRTVNNNQASLEKSATRLAELQIAITMLSRDFEQIIERPVTKINGAIETALLGTPNMITFTHAGYVNPQGALLRSTLQRTHYAIENGKLTRETWAALDQTSKTPVSKRILLNQVSDLQFQYLDQDNRVQNRWPPAEQSAASNDIPHAIRVFISLRDLGKISQTYVIPGQKRAKPN